MMTGEFIGGQTIVTIVTQSSIVASVYLTNNKYSLCPLGMIVAEVYTGD